MNSKEIFMARDDISALVALTERQVLLLDELCQEILAGEQGSYSDKEKDAVKRAREQLAIARFALRDQHE